MNCPRAWLVVFERGLQFMLAGLVQATASNKESPANRALPLDAAIDGQFLFHVDQQLAAELRIGFRRRIFGNV